MRLAGCGGCLPWCRCGVALPPQIGEEPDPRIIARPRRVIDHLSPSSGIGDIIWKVPEGQRYVVEHGEKEVPEGQRMFGRSWSSEVPEGQRRYVSDRAGSQPTDYLGTAGEKVSRSCTCILPHLTHIDHPTSPYRIPTHISVMHCLPLPCMTGRVPAPMLRAVSRVCPPAWRALELVF